MNELSSALELTTPHPHNMDLLGLIDLPVWILFLLGLLTTAYIYYTWEFGAFDGYGLPGPKAYPVLGTQGPSLTKGLLPMDEDIMRKYGRIVRMFLGRMPAIFTTDVDIIKAVFVKDFNHFSHRMDISNGKDILTDMLFNTSGDKWRRLRHLMSPTFSTGKLRKMNEQVNKCAKILVDNMEDYIKSEKPCEIKTPVQAFAMDTIAATAFGLDLNSHSDPNNPFVKYGRKMSNIGQFNPVFIATFFFPFLRPIFHLLNISILNNEATEFFSNFIKQVMAERKKMGTEKVDFLQLMLNAHQENETENDVTDKVFYDVVGNTEVNKKAMNQKEVKAQAVLFFLAGFDNIASSLSSLCYYLAVYPEIQEKLYQEIIEHTSEKDMVEYSTLSEMPYLDQCINETLRLVSPGIRLDRTCSRDVTIKGIHIKKDMTVIVPVYALHRDPELWSDPEEFIPERFADMSKIGFKYMPFGVGPRNCIGMRLALMEVKVAAVHLLRKYKLLKTPDTLFPMKFDPYKFVQPIKPILLGLQRRE